MPEAPRRRAQVQAFALAIAADLQPLQNTGTLNYLRDTVGVDDAGRALWLRHFLERGLAALETEAAARPSTPFVRSEEHTSELQSLMSISYAVFCLKKKKQ